MSMLDYSQRFRKGGPIRVMSIQYGIARSQNKGMEQPTNSPIKNKIAKIFDEILRNSPRDTRVTMLTESSERKVRTKSFLNTPLKKEETFGPVFEKKASGFSKRTVFESKTPGTAKAWEGKTIFEDMKQKNRYNMILGTRNTTLESHRKPSLGIQRNPLKISGESPNEICEFPVRDFQRLTNFIINQPKSYFDTLPVSCIIELKKLRSQIQFKLPSF